MANGKSILLGFDFPIGVPKAYAELAGIHKFTGALERFGHGAWNDFYNVAHSRREITLHRPFYPHSPGGTNHRHLTAALGVDSVKELLRECERATEHRAAASPLFWTLGGKQVGRAAIIGWRDVLAPAKRDRNVDIAFWPFDGDLFSLLTEHRITVAETYPSQACVNLGIPAPGRGWSKRQQGDRAMHAVCLLSWARTRQVKLRENLAASIADGFGSDAKGEDQFDSVVGLFGMLDVVLGHCPPGAPNRQEITSVEGWILGQEDRN
jgi:hypothetical protein